MQQPTALCLCLGLLVAPLTATQDGPSAPANELMEADRAFLADTAEQGLAGWLSWFAADAIVLKVDGTAASGSAGLRDHYGSVPGFPPAGFRWEPKSAGVSSSGDLGWTAGTYSTSQQEEAGNYLSVWARQADGEWKVLTDLGGDPGFRTELTHLSGPPDETAMKALDSRVAEDGELAVSTGIWSASRGDRSIRGRYLSVWESSTEGAWSVVTEIGITDR